MKCIGVKSDALECSDIFVLVKPDNKNEFIIHHWQYDITSTHDTTHML